MLFTSVFGIPHISVRKISLELCQFKDNIFCGLLNHRHTAKMNRILRLSIGKINPKKSYMHNWILEEVQHKNRHVQSKTEKEELKERQRNK